MSENEIANQAAYKWVSISTGAHILFGCRFVLGHYLRLPEGAYKVCVKQGLARLEHSVADTEEAARKRIEQAHDIQL